MKRKWTGTALFFAIFVVMGATFGLRLGTGTPQSAAAAVAAAAPAQSGAGGGTTTTGSAGGTPTGSAGGTPTGSAGGTPTGSSPAAAAGSAATTITGASESTPYGNVQVSVSFSGKKITGVTVLQVPNSGSYDRQVAQAVPPILEKEVLSSQSASVNTVSGGTYTSTGYLQSVQSAIDKLA
ncbi:MAG: FMN-binding protein [Acidobacteria bacterium]|nr:FMN-binding protein [Acidobacteriota bacterium]